MMIDQGQAGGMSEFDNPREHGAKVELMGRKASVE